MEKQIENFDFNVEKLSLKEAEAVNGGGLFAHWIGDVLQWMSQNCGENYICA